MEKPKNCCHYDKDRTKQSIGILKDCLNVGRRSKMTEEQ